MKRVLVVPWSMDPMKHFFNFSSSRWVPEWESVTLSLGIGWKSAPRAGVSPDAMSVVGWVFVRFAAELFVETEREISRVEFGDSVLTSGSGCCSEMPMTSCAKPRGLAAPAVVRTEKKRWTKKVLGSQLRQDAECAECSCLLKAGHAD